MGRQSLVSSLFRLHGVHNFFSGWVLRVLVFHNIGFVCCAVRCGRAWAALAVGS